MQLTQSQVKKFQLLYKERFSVDLPEDEAREKGLKLIQMVQQSHNPVQNKHNKSNNMKNYNEPSTSETHKQILS